MATENFQFEPGSYLEIIPWDELNFTTAPDNLPTQFLPDFKPISKNESEDLSPWALWDAGIGNRRLLFYHHIVTEEEVYQYHLQEGYTSKLLLQDEKVLFALLPLEETTFLSDINTFWSFWVCTRQLKIFY
jgi:hypothetical protein